MFKRVFLKLKFIDRKDGLWLSTFGMLVALLIFLPLWVGDYSLSIIRDAVIFGIFALSLDYLWGKADLLSFGHAAFFGMGAYAMAIVTKNLEFANVSLLGMLAAVTVPGVIALLSGYFLIFAGIRGPYFVIFTLALGIISQQAAISWVKVTGGDSGLLGIPPISFDIFHFHYEFSNAFSIYYLIVAVAAVSVLALWIACRGNYGKVLKAIQDNEIRAQSLGHHTSFHLLVVMVVSAMMAGCAGGLYASSTGFVAPDLLGMLLSTEVFVWVVIGGRGTLIGPFIGAFIILRLQQTISSINFNLWPLLIGGFFIAMVFLFPDGILSIFRYVSRVVGFKGKSRKSL